MKTTEFSFLADDGKSIHTYRWSPDGAVKACVLLAHGMGDHASRYESFAETLTQAGFEVWAPDHRGHGKTASEGELGWLADKNGFRRVVEDLHSLSMRIKSERPGLKLFLFGHSWGSFLSQGFISLYGNELAGCVLSATAGSGGPIVAVGRLIAALGCLFKGQKTKSPLMDSMSFGAFNSEFKPNRTAFDWLTSDEAIVDAYLADPLCGFVCTFGFFRDLLAGLSWIHARKAMRSIPKELPLYMFAGEKDPVGAASGKFDALYNAYKRLGIKDLAKKIYPGGRHEMLNERAKVEVMADVRGWLLAHT